MKKKLDTSSVMNELRGQSAFFPNREQHQEQTEQVTPEPLEPIQPEHDSELASKHASTLADNDIIETIRKTLRLLGKEVVYVRSTAEEKAQLSDIVYTYKRRGVKTSDNEIGRIAINFLLEDYKVHGEGSILAKTLTALHI